MPEQDAPTIEGVTFTTKCSVDVPCGSCAKCMGPEMYDNDWHWGGATSWEEYDAHMLMEAEAEVTETLEHLMENVMGNKDLTPDDKRVLLDKLLSGFSGRVQDVKSTKDGIIGRIAKALTAQPEKATWTTAFINELPDSAFAYIEPGGEKDADGKTTPRSNRYFPHHAKNGQVDLPHLRNALARVPQSPVGSKAKPHLEAHAKAEEIGAYAKAENEGRLNVFKDARGDWRWVGVVSNKFYDEEREVLTLKAHEAFADYVEATGDYPELWVWHTPGSRIGVADAVAVIGGFRVDTGTFDKGMEDVAAALAKDEGLAMSHGFEYHEDSFDGETYTQYRTLEDSVLPFKNAANKYTSFTISEVIKEAKEDEMTLTAERREFLVEKLGEDRVARLEESLPEFTKQLEEAGVGWKSTGDADDGVYLDNLLSIFKDDPDPEPKPNGDGNGDGEANGEGEGEGEGDDAGDGEGASDAADIGSQIGALTTAVTTLTEVVQGQAKSIAALERNDQGIQEALGLRRPDPQGGNRPTEDERTNAEGGNIIPEDIVAKVFGDSGEVKDEGPVNPAAPYVQDLFRNSAVGSIRR